MKHSGDFHAYYLRRIGVVSALADALSREGQGSVFMGKAETTFPVVSEIPPLAPVASLKPVPAVPAVATHEPAAAQQADNPACTDIVALRDAASRCMSCALSETRKQVVFGAGSNHPDVLFIGEAPGDREDEQGEPFVGPAGQLLDRMLGALHWSRDNVYIMNVIKCRPPGNRDPQPGEVQACSRWFDAQWDILQPKVVCLLGRVAAQKVLGIDASLSSLRGRWHAYRGVPVRVTYHPAYLLRTPTGKAAAWQDFRALAALSKSMKGPVRNV